MPSLFRYDVMKSIIYTTNARVKDPVGGCVRDIKTLLSKIQYSLIELYFVISATNNIIRHLHFQNQQFQNQTF